MTGTVWPALALLVALTSAVVVSPARARAPGVPLPTSEADKPMPASIPVPEVARQADEAARILRDFDAILASSPATETAEKRLPEITARIAKEAEETRQATETDPSPATLDRLTTRWQVTRGELAGYVNGLARQATTAEEALQRLTRMRDTWTRTRADALASRAPEPVIHRIDGVLASIVSSRTRLLGHRGATLVLQDRVAQEVAQCDAMLDRVAAARQGTTVGLLERDAGTPWQVFGRDGEVAQSIRDTAATNAAQVRQFAQEQRGRILLHAAIFLGFFLLIQAAGRRAGFSTAPAEWTPHAVLVDRPISAALVLTVPLSSWVYTPPIPRPAATVVAIMALVPAVRILRRVLPPHLAPHIYGLGLFFLVDLLRNLASGAPVLERQIFLLEMLAGVVLLGWRGVVWWRTEPGGGPHPSRALNVLGAIVLLTFTAALVAGAAGYMRLALLLGAGVLGNAYLAVVLYAAVWVAEGLVAFALHGWPLSTLAMVRHNRPLLQRRAHTALRVLTAAAWVYFSLKYFHLWNDAVAGAQAAFAATLKRGSLSVSLGDVLVFTVTVGVAFLLSRMVRFFLAEEIYPRWNLGRGLPDALSGVLHYTLLLVGFLLALAALGVDLTKVTILASAFGVGIGFGLQGVVNNLVSGSIILVERKINVGDAVQIGDVAGLVQQMGMRACTVRTWEGAEVIVPNASLTSGSVVNWTLSDAQRRIDLAVRVAYGTPPEKVLDVLMGVASAHPRVLPVPAPAALLRSFGDSALQFELRVWTDRFDLAPQTQSELSVALYTALREAGIEIPFPQQEVHYRQKPT